MKHEGKFEGREVQPRPVRVDADCDVRVECAAGAFSAQVLNLSGDGFRLRSNAALQPGSVVTLVARGHGPVKALICWAHGRDSGGVFAEPVAL